MTNKLRVMAFFESNMNKWISTAEIAQGSGLTITQARNAANSLLAEGSLINRWKGKPMKAYRTRAGYMQSSTFEARKLPQAIFFGEQIIAGPFCKHCGNPASVHSSDEQACLNYRIHPLLPVGDLPRASQPA